MLPLLVLQLTMAAPVPIVKANDPVLRVAAAQDEVQAGDPLILVVSLENGATELPLKGRLSESSACVSCVARPPKGTEFQKVVTASTLYPITHSEHLYDYRLPPRREERFFVHCVFKDGADSHVVGKWKIRVSVSGPGKDSFSAEVVVTVVDRPQKTLATFRDLSNISYLYPLSVPSADEVPGLKAAAELLRGSATSAILLNRLLLHKLSAVRTDADLDKQLADIAEVRKDISPIYRELLDLGAAQVLLRKQKVELVEKTIGGIRRPSETLDLIKLGLDELKRAKKK